MGNFSYVDYGRALAGRIKKRRLMHPIGAYMAQRGGTYSTNEFVDPELQMTEDHFENILMLIESAKKQQHSGLTVLLTPDCLEVISTRIAEISELGFLDVKIQSSPEDKGLGKLTVTFREGQIDSTEV